MGKAEQVGKDKPNYIHRNIKSTTEYKRQKTRLFKTVN